ncbi:MAPEG family protein [Bradyrhizobium liaoningense]|uniref:MAPEG family protein n=1 Tax=Bradyrhizobium liaoningense TaxID=43992 RepID=UPI001BA68855|nr:MAPEG family protein [Bradyrhizobium liaoningense]MBR0718765.1 MAPEG family protein [Bradyrhizobium liaoningense]
MTTDLKYMVLTAMLTAALWIPYIVCQVRTNGPLEPKNYVDPAPRPVPAWGQRAHRAYLNAIEVFAPYAALVLTAQLAGKANAMTAFWAASFFYLRLAHAIVYWAGIPYLRTILFTLAFVAEVGIFWELIK